MPPASTAASKGSTNPQQANTGAITSSARATKKSAFSCEPCRRRKVKCGGEQPICSRCLARNDACVYKLNPTLSYTQRLEERIKELEDQLATARSPSAARSHDGCSSERPGLSSSEGAHRNQESSEGLAGTFKGLKLDERGVLTYHGATSFFNLPSDYTGSEGDVPVSPHSEHPLNGRRERLVNNAWQQRALENLSEIPEPFQYLINTHWCWIQPLFNFIYRPAFTRDMQLLGPYYSHTLLNAILSHSVRWGRWDNSTRERLEQEYDGGAVFGRHARTMVFDEVSRGVATIPTVQTLLLLSAQDCSQGNTSQAWMYSGMAFRMIDHLGICVDSQRYTGDIPFSDEDVEIRRRLFWSCYFWDKIISLYLGRSPSLQHSPVSPPQMILDDSNENETWAPFGLKYPDGVKYPPIAAHSTSCFMLMCQLSVIFNQILIHMYDPLQQNSEAEIQECLTRQEAALKKWWEDLPSFLKIEASVLPPLSPPSHVVTLNCLYHTFNILLHRPMLSRERSSAETNRARHLLECVSSATSIIAIFDLFCRSFGIYRSVLSLSYSVYIASSIFLLQLQAAAGISGILTEEEQQQQQPAIRKLDFCIRALSRLKDINPIVGSAVSLILRELANLGIRTLGLGAGIDFSRQGPSNSTYQAHQHTASSSSASKGRRNSILGVGQRLSHYEIMMGNTDSFVSTSDSSNSGSLYSQQTLFQCPERGQGDKIDHHLQHHGISNQVFQAVSSVQPISASFGDVTNQEQQDALR
ncbi:fungal-specific transcription factor domain-domain-containing protein [Coniella lustricola]|uniref:Fungal-specific transcription factor domain-domain-containing protein n=1 Tax=Coniella lustricola TaxID=2025994 RepID=A0A2T3A8U4_9PEZI|nr:fungal-specific transcription factor domain-domain-containing protein [Coniella lustricola]